MWNGADQHIQLYLNETGVTYPVLMNAGLAGIGDSYNTGTSYFFVIGGDGIIRWRGTWDPAVIGHHVEVALSELDTPAPAGPPVAANVQLEAAYPNPFNPLTTIPYQLPDRAESYAVRLDIVDPLGRRVQTLFSGRQAGGNRYQAEWNGTNSFGSSVPSGVYFARLSVGGEVQARMLTLTK